MGKHITLREMAYRPEAYEGVFLDVNVEEQDPVITNKRTGAGAYVLGNNGGEVVWSVPWGVYEVCITSVFNNRFAVFEVEPGDDLIIKLGGNASGASGGFNGGANGTLWTPMNGSVPYGPDVTTASDGASTVETNTGKLLFAAPGRPGLGVTRFDNGSGLYDGLIDCELAYAWNTYYTPDPTITPYPNEMPVGPLVPSSFLGIIPDSVVVMDGTSFTHTHTRNGRIGDTYTFSNASGDYTMVTGSGSGGKGGGTSGLVLLQWDNYLMTASPYVTAAEAFEDEDEYPDNFTPVAMPGAYGGSYVHPDALINDWLDTYYPWQAPWFNNTHNLLSHFIAVIWRKLTPWNMDLFKFGLSIDVPEDYVIGPPS